MKLLLIGTFESGEVWEERFDRWEFVPRIGCKVSIKRRDGSVVKILIREVVEYLEVATGTRTDLHVDRGSPMSDVPITELRRCAGGSRGEIHMVVSGTAWLVSAPPDLHGETPF